MATTPNLGLTYLEIGQKDKTITINDNMDLIDNISISGGATTFIALTDTPANYTSAGLKLVRVNSGATALEFVDGSTIFQYSDAQLTDIAGTTITKGNLIVANGTNYVNLGVGTNNYVLTADSTQASGIKWAAVPELNRLTDVNAQTSSYTLALSDENKLVQMNVATANNLTVPPNSSIAFSVGTVIHVVQLGAGQTTIVAGSGVTIRTPETLKLKKQYSTVSLVKMATDTWLVAGYLEAA